MSKNAIFIRTAKAENASADLSIDLKRVLSYMDGKSRSDDLAKRAPPSLRRQWNELLAELVEGGYIVFNSKAKIEEKTVPRDLDPKAGLVNKAIVVNASEPSYQRLSAADQVVAELEAAAAALEYAAKHKDSSGSSAAARVVAELESAAAAARPPNAETIAAAKAKQEAEAIAKAKAEIEDKQKAEKAARAAELKAFFASAKEKANAETKELKKEAARVSAEHESAAAAAKAKSDAEAETKIEAARREQEAARVRAEKESAAAAAKAKSELNAKAKAEAKRKEQEASRAQLESAVAAAKERSAAQADARAAAKQREQETAQACAELEAAILATKVASDLKVSAWQEVEAETPIAKPGRKYIGDPRPYVWRAKLGDPQTGDVQRLRELEIENECLKKLLTDAYVEIEILKAPKP